MNRKPLPIPAFLRKLGVASAAALALGLAAGAMGTPTSHAAQAPAADGAPAPAPQYVRHTQYCTKAGCFLFTCIYDDNTNKLIECWVRWDPAPPEPGPRGPSPSLP